MSNKKKWYQTGEFEDGYQFGDIFRTIGNAISGDKEKSNTNKSKKASDNKKETEAKKSQSSNLTLVGVKDGKLTFDPAAQAHGFTSEAERKRYQQQNPNLYAVTGGYKYEPSVLSKNYTPLTDEGEKIVERAINADNEIKGIKTFDNKITDILVNNAKRKSFTGEKLTVAEFGAVKSTNTALVNPKNRSEAYNLFKAEQLKNTTKKYTSLFYNDDFISSVNKAKKIDIDNSDITDKGTYKNIKSNSDIYKYMTSDEKDLYYYLVDKADNAEIRNYVLYIKPFLETRKAEDVAEKTKPVPIENLGDVVKNVENFRKRTAYAATSGFSGALMNMARSGVTNAWNNNSINAANLLMNILDATYQEKVYSSISANAYDENFVYGLWLDIVNNTASQIPEIAMGAAGGQGMYVGGVLLKTLGANTTEAIQNGQDYEKGVLHSIIDTSIELLPDMLTGTGMMSVLGNGASSYSTKVIKWCDEIFDDPKVAKAASKTLIAAGNSSAEGNQELIQKLLEPTIRNIIYGETNAVDEETFKDALKGYFIGFFSSAPITAVSASNNYNDLNLQSIGTALKQESVIKPIIQLARFTETYTNEYTEIVRAYETGNAENIDTTALGKLYIDAANEFVNPSEERLRNISSKAVNEIIEKAKEYQASSAGKRLNSVRNLIKERAKQLGADNLTAEKIGNNIAGKETINEDIFNNNIAKQIIFELQQGKEKQAEWVKKVSSILQSDINNTAQQVSGSINNDFNYIKPEPRQTINADEFIEGLWWENRKRADKSSDIANVENWDKESVENVEENIYNEIALHSLDDPMQEVTGTAEKSHPKEIESFKKEIENSGVILKRSNRERIGYAPGLKKGEPGVLYISDNASFSAWCHEMQHMRDDRALGWCGMSIIADPNMRFKWETKAYNIEIEFAKELGRNDIVKRLTENLEKERKKIYGE